MHKRVLFFFLLLSSVSLAQSKKKQITALNYRLDSLSLVLSTERSKNYEKINSLNNTLTSLQSQNGSLFTKVDNLNKELSEANKEISCKNSQLQSTQNELNEMQRQNLLQQKEIENLRAEIQSLKDLSNQSDDFQSMDQDENQDTRIVEFDSRFSSDPDGTEIFYSYNQVEEEKFIEILNAARIKKNMVPLELDYDLTRAARYHAYDMANEDYFSHKTENRVNGNLIETLKPFDRIKLFYSGGANTENIYMGSELAEDAYESWYNSPGHYKNMFNANTNKVGIGLAKSPSGESGFYWVFCSAYE